MSYYGNPDTLKILNKNLQTLVGNDYLAQVEAMNGLVVGQLEADLGVIFTSWPDPASEDTNIVSTLWLYLMTAEFQESKFATNATGSPSAYADKMREKYATLMEKLKAGKMQLPGAVRGSRPASSNASGKRWKISDVDSPDEPEGVADNFQRGLRQ